VTFDLDLWHLYIRWRYFDLIPAVWAMSTQHTAAVRAEAYLPVRGSWTPDPGELKLTWQYAGAPLTHRFFNLHIVLLGHIERVPNKWNGNRKAHNAKVEVTAGFWRRRHGSVAKALDSYLTILVSFLIVTCVSLNRIQRKYPTLCILVCEP